ncbi:MAG TPA: acyl carrier protein [Holophaga sp.]|nr:acyl carrier protein [Holophaga sp.]HPS66249.1 acyl carrier protein [Holophaga sp.]
MPTIESVRAILAELAQAPVPEDLDSSLFEAGVIDSFGVMDLVERLEKAFGIRIPDQDMVPRRFESISKIARYVDQHKGA